MCDTERPKMSGL